MDGLSSQGYSVLGATAGSFHWFGAFPEDAKDNLEFMKHKLEMPLLAMGAEYSAASYFGDHCRLVANNVTEVKIEGAGHWIIENSKMLCIYLKFLKKIFTDNLYFSCNRAHIEY